MILSGKTIKLNGIVDPHYPRTQMTLPDGKLISYGESFAGYDIRIKNKTLLLAGLTVLASSVERFKLPTGVMGIVHDKSSWARRGISVQNTVLEPGWEGYLTLELLYSPRVSREIRFVLEAGWPVAQVVFHWIDSPTSGYDGKYQNQADEPVEAM